MESVLNIANPKSDEIQRYFLIRHIFLQQLSVILLKRQQRYYTEYVDFNELDDDIEKNYSIFKCSRTELDFISTGLDIEDYIRVTVLILDDGSKTPFVRMLKKGMTSVLTGEFKMLAVKRETEIRNLTLIEKSIKAHKDQKFLNGFLILATFLAAVMPFVVAEFFPPKIIVTVPEQVFRPDIRIDSVWLHRQVDDVIQKRLSIPQQAEAKGRPHPKKGVQ